jgi:hypothetical protein
MAKTAIERVIEWLDNQPPLMPRSFYKKQLQKMRAIEKHNIKVAYNAGWSNYTHPRKWKMTPEEFYQKRYGPNAKKRPYLKEKEKFQLIQTKIKNNVTNGNEMG